VTQNLTFLILGLGNGAILAAFGLSLAVFYRSSGVVNFATGAIGMYAAYTFNGLRTQGQLFNPIFGLPAQVKLSSGAMPTWLALVVTVAVSAVLGLLCYLIVFRQLRHARALAKAVASVGVMLVLEGVVALRLGTSPVGVAPLFPSGTFKLGGLVIPEDRVWTAALAVALLAAAVVIYNYTRFGVVTRAVVESEKGSVIVGVSPERIALANWAVGAAVAGLAGAVVSPLVPLTPSGFTLLVVPALAVALIGRFSAMVPIVVAGLLLGMAQSDISFQDVQSWYPHWLGTGAQDLLPLLIVLVVLIIRGSPLPTRGTITLQALPRRLERRPGLRRRPARPDLPAGQLPRRADDIARPGLARAVLRRHHRLRRPDLLRPVQPGRSLGAAARAHDHAVGHPVPGGPGPGRAVRGGHRRADRLAGAPGAGREPGRRHDRGCRRHRLALLPERRGQRRHRGRSRRRAAALRT
jgi:branched-subunit amino acid ABC-type transport system permease component